LLGKYLFSLSSLRICALLEPPNIFFDGNCHAQAIYKTPPTIRQRAGGQKAVRTKGVDGGAKKLAALGQKGLQFVELSRLLTACPRH